jgi:hypothetical protein
MGVCHEQQIRKVHPAGIYLRNWSARTVRTYRQGLKRLPTEIPTKSQLDAWVVQMRQDGLTPGGCNMYIRTINSYLSWLHEERDLDQPLKVKLLRAPQKQLTLLSDADIRATRQQGFTLACREV